MRSRELTATRLGIWGFGMEGRAALRALTPSHATVVVVDEREDAADVAGAADAAAVGPIPGIEFSWGNNQLERLLDCDLVVVSPGVPRTHPFLAKLKANDVQVTSGSAMWLESNAHRTIGITGTKGKSTTSTLVHDILRRGSAGSLLAGNIGLPLIGVPEDDRRVVAELSSYQCAWITRSPRVAVVTNLFEEHLPWHGTLRKYWQDKARIITEGAEFLICDSETLDKLQSVDADVSQASWLLVQTSGPDIVAADGTPVLTVADLPASLAARHLVSSVRAAVLAASAALGASVSSADLLAALRGFTPLPHRCETIGTFAGLVWVDDTLSTTAESVIAAVETSHADHIVLIVGGQDRGISYKPLNDFLVASPVSVDVIAIPSNGPSAVSPYRKLRPEKVHTVANLREAVRLASVIGSPGSQVILSPGAPSHDYYRSYREKSAEFRQAVLRLGITP